MKSLHSSTAAPGMKISGQRLGHSGADDWTIRRRVSAGFGSSAASAPAPAREAKPPRRLSRSPRALRPEKRQTRARTVPQIEGTSAPAPAFTFGGNVSSDAKAARGGSKKALLVAAAVVVVVVGGYLLWMQWVRSRGGNSFHAGDHAGDETCRASASSVQGGWRRRIVRLLLTTSSGLFWFQTLEPVQKQRGQPRPHPILMNQTLEPARMKQFIRSKVNPKADSAKPAGSALTANKASATKADATPIVTEEWPPQAAAKSAPAPDAPSITGIAAADNGGSLWVLWAATAKRRLPCCRC